MISGRLVRSRNYKLCLALLYFAFLVVCQVVSGSTVAVHGCFLYLN